MMNFVLILILLDKSTIFYFYYVIFVRNPGFLMTIRIRQIY